MNFSPFNDIHEKIQAGERLSFEDGVRLYKTNDLATLGGLAQIIRRRMNSNRVYYSVNLHLNHTNVCTLRCLFCAFARRPGEEGGYTFSVEEIQDKVREAIEKWQINEVHIVGGHNPELGLDYYLRMIRAIRDCHPEVFARHPEERSDEGSQILRFAQNDERGLPRPIYIKALTAPEIDDIATREGISYQEVLNQLKQAGLDGMPGGGAEIFHPRTRQKICKDKISAGTWLEIHKIAHGLSLRTNASMLYGHIETDEDRVDHVLRLRELQDETRGFYSFIALAYNAENTPMGKLGEAGGFLDLKVYAVSRLLLDNIPHIKAHWITTGLKMAQVALSFGVDDLGGTNLNEKIVHDAGSKTPIDLSADELEHLIRSAGYEPCLVDSSYEHVS